MNGVLSGREEFHHLNHRDHTPRETHHRSKPSRGELSISRLTRMIVEADGVDLMDHDRLMPCMRVGIDGIEGLLGISRDLADQLMGPGDHSTRLPTSRPGQ
jgi:hypothetical protein